MVKRNGNKKTVPKKSRKKTVGKNNITNKGRLSKPNDKISRKNDLPIGPTSPSNDKSLHIGKDSHKDNEMMLAEATTPLSNNSDKVVKYVTPTTQNDTLKSSEKPPESNLDMAATYKTTLLDTIDIPMTDPAKQSTF